MLLLYSDHEIPVGGIIIDSPWSMSYNHLPWYHDDETTEISYSFGKIEVYSKIEHSFVFLVKCSKDSEAMIEIRKRGKKFTLAIEDTACK